LEFRDFWAKPNRVKHVFANLSLDSILPHGEILLTLLLPLGLQGELYNKK
jgi:hypothetical protein